VHGGNAFISTWLGWLRAFTVEVALLTAIEAFVSGVALHVV